MEIIDKFLKEDSSYWTLRLDLYNKGLDINWVYISYLSLSGMGNSIYSRRRSGEKPGKERFRRKGHYILLDLWGHISS